MRQGSLFCQQNKALLNWLFCKRCCQLLLIKGSTGTKRRVSGCPRSGMKVRAITQTFFSDHSKSLWSELGISDFKIIYENTTFRPKSLWSELRNRISKGLWSEISALMVRKKGLISSAWDYFLEKHTISRRTSESCSLKGFCPSGEEMFQGGPPWNISADLTKIEISRRVVRVIQNPSGFGVFRPMSTPGFKGFGSNFLILEKSLFEFRIF